jgi:hypothetical protein
MNSYGGLRFDTQILRYPDVAIGCKSILEAITDRLIKNELVKEDQVKAFYEQKQDIIISR